MSRTSRLWQTRLDDVAAVPVGLETNKTLVPKFRSTNNSGFFCVEGGKDDETEAVPNAAQGWLQHTACQRGTPALLVE